MKAPTCRAMGALAQGGGPAAGGRSTAPLWGRANLGVLGTGDQRAVEITSVAHHSAPPQLSDSGAVWMTAHATS